MKNIHYLTAALLIIALYACNRCDKIAPNHFDILNVDSTVSSFITIGKYTKDENFKTMVDSPIALPIKFNNGKGLVEELRLDIGADYIAVINHPARIYFITNMHFGHEKEKYTGSTYTCARSFYYTVNGVERKQETYVGAAPANTGGITLD